MLIFDILNNMNIKLFLTGGTIDKKYNELTGELGFADTCVNDILKQARLTVELDIEQLMLVDSLGITDGQRQIILDACVNTQSDRIVITHGTDTMVQTAELLGMNIKNKTIVLTGSMIPYSLCSSDALFNVGSSITAVQLLEPGVYVVMNGKIFNWNNVIKNKDLGEFQLL